MPLGVWLEKERKCSTTVVGLDLLLALSRVRRCSLNLIQITYSRFPDERFKNFPYINAPNLNFPLYLKKAGLARRNMLLPPPPQKKKTLRVSALPLALITFFLYRMDESR